MAGVLDAQMTWGKNIVTLELVRPTTLWTYNSIWRSLLREEGSNLRFGNRRSASAYGWPWDIIGIGNWRKFTITLDGPEIIGVADLFMDKPNATCSIELGLLPKYRGRGLGGFVGRKLIRKCFTDYGARRVESSSLSTNPASMNMHDWMLLEGTLKGKFLIEGREVDEVMYRILRPEWMLIEQRMWVHAEHRREEVQN